MSSNVPEWWNQALQSDVTRMVDDGYPNEVVGLFLLDKSNLGNVVIKTPASENIRSSPEAFFVFPQAVISMAYEIAESGFELLGTFHSHPRGGCGWFSDKDFSLTWWGSWHLLCTMRTGTYKWDFIWGTSRTQSQN